MKRAETATAALVVAAGVLALAAFGGEVLWTRPLWFDELCCVVYVVSDASSPVEVAARVARSWDYAPPLLHLITWGAARITGGEVTPVLLRTTSLLAVCGALLFVYATLRRTFGRLPSGAGALAVATHPLVVAHAFEGRFYGPWLLFAAGYAWSLALSSRAGPEPSVSQRSSSDGGSGSARAGPDSPVPTPPSRAGTLAQATFAVLLVAIHWFGVVSLTLMLGAAVLAARGPIAARLRALAPSAAGLVALVVLVPMAVAQRSGAQGFLWVPELSAAQILAMTRVFWLAVVPIAAVAIVLVAVLRRQVTRDTADIPRQGAMLDAAIDGLRSSWGLAALGGLLLMPAALILISAAVQPSMVDRYGITAVLSWAPLVALAVHGLPRTARAGAVAALGLAAMLAAADEIERQRQFAADVAARASAFERAKTMRLPIVFWGLHSIYPVAGPLSERPPAALARYLDLPDSTLFAMFPEDAMAPVRKKYRLDRDQARGHARTYGFPIMATQAQLDTTPRFLLLADDLALPGGYKRPDVFGRVLFPHHRVSRVGDRTSLFERLP